jgi:uncharacterized membrane protein YGL010W
LRTAADWLDEYGASHRHPTNKLLHWICVPAIVWCVVGLLWSLPVPGAMLDASPQLNWAAIALAAAVIYYSVLSLRLALGALVLLAAMLWSVEALARVTTVVPIWAVSAAVFVAAWIGQFFGHAIEGRRPSFFKDMQFLLIGPLWLLADLYRRLGLRC